MLLLSDLFIVERSFVLNRDILGSFSPYSLSELKDQINKSNSFQK